MRYVTFAIDTENSTITLFTTSNVDPFLLVTIANLLLPFDEIYSIKDPSLIDLPSIALTRFFGFDVKDPDLYALMRKEEDVLLTGEFP